MSDDNNVDINSILEAAAQPDAAPSLVSTFVKPDVAKPDVEKPPESKPDAEKPAESKPDVTKTDTDVAKPDIEKTETQAPLSEQAEKLQRVARQRAAEREQRVRAEYSARVASQENTALKERVAALEARAAELQAFERDPLEWYEHHSRDPVEFLQKAHRIALNPSQVRAEREAAEAKARVEALEKREPPKEAIETALRQRELESAQQNLLAQTEMTDTEGRPLYPLFAMENPETRVAYAQSAARQLYERGIRNFSYSDLCDRIETALVRETEKKTAALSAARPQPKTPLADPVAAPALAAKPTTVTQTHTATDIGNVRDLSAAEREALADKIIREQFFENVG